MCNGKCNQGRACVCAPMQTKCGGQRIDTRGLQLPPGISRPIFTKPTLRQRIERAFMRFWYAHVMDRQVQD